MNIESATKFIVGKMEDIKEELAALKVLLSEEEDNEQCKMIQRRIFELSLEVEELRTIIFADSEAEKEEW